MSEIKTNKISSLTSSNSDITLDPDGTGNLIVESGNVGIGTASPATPLTVQSDSSTLSLRLLGRSADDRSDLEFYENDGTTKIAAISTETDNIGIIASGASSTLSMTANTSRFRNTSGTELMRILSSGALCVGKTSTSTAVNGAVFQPGQLSSVTRDGTVFRIRRLTSDGTLIEFYQDTGLEGSISVSGTTVSYNGGHLARWSQLTDGTEDLTIVKGTVMTNLDQMAVWHHEAQPATYYEEGDELPEGVSVGDEKTPAVAAYDEDNEQLNCMAVSSVEGDANVAGVFVNWDDDDDFNDMNIAMTGDMVIRIAQGTTVARGDLLMSAGDGTAKPQGDDIVRSKTIAKVTSTTVSHTYDDGSYLVPCVLMAC